MAEHAAVAGEYALTPMQQGMLYQTLADPEASSNVEQVVLTIDERLDEPAFAAAWAKVIDRHDILRTRFEWSGRQAPVQIVQARAEVPTQYLDSRGRPDVLAQATATDALEPFDLGSAPAMRLTVIRVGETEWRVLWTFHHILADGRSFVLIVRELMQYYHALRNDNPLPELPAPRQFGEFVHWLQSQDDEPCRGYWRNYLAGLSAPTPLPWSPVPDHRDDRGRTGSGRCDRHLSTTTTAALTRIARGRVVGWAGLLETAWAILLWRHTHSRDVVFGVTRGGRPAGLAGGTDIVGLFITTVPKRLPIAPESTAIEIMQAARDATRAGREHERIGLGEIMRQTDALGGPSPLQSVVVYDYRTLDGAVADAVAGTVGDSRWRFTLKQFTGYPLTLLGYGGDALQLTLEYDRRLVEPSIADDLIDRLVVLLEDMAVRGPDVRVADLAWQTPRDVADHLERWNRTERAPGPYACIYDAMAAQAEAAPERIAVVSGDTRTSYAELKQAVDALAARLQKAGVKPGDRVAVAVGRSERMVIATCAVQRAGAAYVPCDPRYPAERLALMWSDAQAHLILTERAVADGLPPSDLPCLLMDDDMAVSGDVAGFVPVTIGPDTPAHVIFTSGSTGRPKGVVVTHRNVMNFLESMAERPGLAAEQRILAVTTLSFDISLVELFLPLVVGAATVIADMDEVLDGRRLAELIERHTIDVIQATPTTYRLLRMAGWQPPGRCKAMVGGETLDPALSEDLRAHAGPGFELWNLYGPTETTVYCSGDPVDDGPIHIGTQTANTFYYVVDTHNRIVAPGVTGELLIGGDCVAQGYFGRPELTAERFIEVSVHPGHPPMRLYHSGDRVRWHRQADGSARLLICGRMDNQVKLRGFRIELGEIEAALAGHDAVDHAAVILRHEGGDRLVAYVRLNTPTDTAALRDYLAARLPAHMLPALFVELDRLPMTQNGKIDRNALPAPAPQRVATGTRYVAPRNDIERAIADIWCTVLGIESPGIDDNFFDVGGDSLRIVTVRGTLETRFSESLTVAELFRHATIRQLAERLDPSGATADNEQRQALDSRAAKRRAALSRRPRTGR
ncbi:amino acid adenylation domain-containing protein [Salinisphaera sp. T31B1]|uniref:non-ribosomal peptide synthetase n=1 Tax=Salinisphaera sp. T31B1 TaxID=727963 RepID=UPI00333EC2C7